MLLFGQPVRQIAYCVTDIEAAAARHIATFGSGPFFVSDTIEFSGVYRGRETQTLGRMAVGQWGAMQVELIEDWSDMANVFNELYPKGSGKTGLHHMAVLVDDLEAALRQLADHGLKEAARTPLPAMNFTAVFVDALERYGHFIELYEPVPALKATYDMVAAAHAGFDGENPIRKLMPLDAAAVAEMAGAST